MGAVCARRRVRVEFSYTAIKRMDVISVSDGKHLGRVCDAMFDFPSGGIRGFYVTGSKGFRFSRQDVFLPLNAIVRIGEDVILTDIDCAPQPKERRGRRHADREEPPEHVSAPPRERRDMSEYE